MPVGHLIVVSSCLPLQAKTAVEQVWSNSLHPSRGWWASDWGWMMLGLCLGWCPNWVWTFRATVCTVPGDLCLLQRTPVLWGLWGDGSELVFWSKPLFIYGVACTAGLQTSADSSCSQDCQYVVSVVMASAGNLVELFLDWGFHLIGSGCSYLGCHFRSVFCELPVTIPEFQSSP